MGKRKKVVDPLADARWGQVRGDEEGIRAEWSGEPSTTEQVFPDQLHEPGEARRPNLLTGDSGDPGGER